LTTPRPDRDQLNAVSKHVKVLEKAGVVRRARQGREATHPQVRLLACSGIYRAERAVLRYHSG